MPEIPDTERCLFCLDLLNFLADDLTVCTNREGVYQGYAHSGHCAHQYKLKEEGCSASTPTST